MSTLHRHLFSIAFTKWAMVLFIGLFLILLGEFIGNMGWYLDVIAEGRGIHFLYYLAFRFPSYMAAWLPISVAVAVLLTAWPMLRQGTLVALCAAGIPLRRIFTSTLVLSLIIGLMGFLLQDQVIPRMNPEAKLAKTRMDGQLQFNQSVTRTVGWHDGDHFWAAQYARPEDGEYYNIAVFSTRTSAPRATVMIADALIWKNGQWELTRPVIVANDVDPVKKLAQASVTEAGFTLTRSAKSLIEYLKQDKNRTSDQLLAVQSDNAWGYIVLRASFGLLPLLCLLFSLPGFVRLDGRHHLGSALARAFIWAIIPLIGYWLLSRVLISNSTYVFTGASVVLGGLLSAGLWRWWTMRL
jgi:lipopolysaccharide export LptBFGC system permease protein LptF